MSTAAISKSDKTKTNRIARKYKPTFEKHFDEDGPLLIGRGNVTNLMMELVQNFIDEKKKSKKSFVNKIVRVLVNYQDSTYTYYSNERARYIEINIPSSYNGVCSFTPEEKMQFLEIL